MVLAVVGVTIGGVASGASTGTTLSVDVPASAASRLSQTYKMTAADLGGFGGKTPSISSPAAIVETMDTGKVLYENKARTRRPMASTTKIMTAILVLESGVDPDSTVRVSARAAGTWEVSKWVNTGDKVTIEDLLYALMLRSMNGAAVALAENDSGSVSAFAKKMNAKARELGMKDTSFVNPHGLDAEGHYSTAADMAIVGRYAMENEQFRTLVDTKQHTIEIDGRTSLLLKNTNQLVIDYSWVNGMKTGSTPKGDYCLVSSGAKNGREVIAVVLGNKDSDTRFEDSLELLQFGLDQYRPVKILDKGHALAEATVPYDPDGTLRLITDGSLETQMAADEVVTTEVTVAKPLRLPVEAGDIYGYVVVKAGDQEVGRVNLVAAKSFERMTLGSKLAYYWHRLLD
jgi:D-alanyl-D-alanine carboxypeptidase (penicillin-binding protein 5/6)